MMQTRDMSRARSGNFRSGKYRRAARLMGAVGAYTAPQGVECDRCRRSDSTGGFKDDELRNGAGRRRTAEGTVIKMGMGIRVMVVMRRHLHRSRVRAQLQQKGSPARRHESDGDVGSKQKHRQQNAGA